MIEKLTDLYTKIGYPTEYATLTLASYGAHRGARELAKNLPIELPNLNYTAVGLAVFLSLILLSGAYTYYQMRKDPDYRRQIEEMEEMES